MKTYDKLKQLAPFVRQLLGAGAISAGTTALAAQSVAVTAAVAAAQPTDPTVIIGATAVAALSQTAAAIFGNRASDFFKDVLRRKDYGFNGDLQKAYNDALRLAFNELSDKYQREYRDANHQQVNAFFESLQDYAHISDNTDEVSMHSLLDAYIHNKEIFSGVLGEVLEVEPFSIEASLLDFLVKEFPAALEHAFLAQLKEPEHERARVSFTIYLSKETLRLAKANGEELAAVTLLLGQVAKAQRLGTDLQAEALRVQQAAYDKLRQIGYDVKRIESKLDALAQKAAPKLPLSLPESDPRLQQHLFGFRARYTTFIGREKEMEQLETFFWSDYHDVKFRWMLVTGPGGAGKSRLALELCHKLRAAGCHAGFLHVDHLPDLQKYEPQEATLVVIDYIATHAEKVSDCIIKLHRRKSEVGYELKYPVRVLLLERDTNGAWWKEFENRDEVMSCGFRSDNSPGYILPLQGFDPNDQWAIIRQVYYKRTGTHLDDRRKVEILTELHRIDPGERPLFAFFVGSALADDPRQNLRGWNVHDLLDNLLKREKEQFWEQHEAYERREPKPHENLLALATLTQGLLQEDVITLCERIAGEGKWLPEEPSLDLYKRMAGITTDPETGITIWEGLQPDLLGEYFLITRLGEWMQENVVKGKKAVVAFIQSAWEIRPAATRDFITKTLKDYEAFSGTDTYRLLIRTCPSYRAPREAWSEWGWLHVYRAYRPLASAGEWSSGVKHYEILKQEAAQPTEETTAALLATRQAQAAFNLTNYFGEKEKLETAESYYQQLEQLVDRFPTSETIAIIQAQAAVNLIGYFDKEGKLETAQSYYQQLAQLAGKFLGSETIALAQAQAAVNLTIDFGKDGKLETAESYYQQIQQLVERFPINETIAAQQAKAAVNLIGYFGDKGELETAESYYQQIQQLVERFPISENIAELFATRQAQAAFNLTIDFGEKGELETAEGYYQQIQQLVKRFPTSETIATQQAKAAFNLTIYFGKEGKLDTAKSYYQQIQQLVKRFPTSETIAAQQAKAAVNLTVYFGKEGKLETAENYYQQIKQLVEQFPTSETIATLQAKVAVNLTNCFGEKGKLETAQSCYQQIQQLVGRFPISENIAIIQAKAAVNLTIDFGKKGEREKVEDYYQHIQQLAEKFPTSETIATEQAKVAFFLKNEFEKRRDSTTAERYYRQLVQLSERFPGSEDIAELLQ